jgi:hypothetical protein
VATLKIPERHHDGVAAVKALQEFAVRAFVTQLDGDYGHGDGKSFAKHHKIPGLDDAETALLYDTLRELYRVREEEHVGPEVFVDRLIEAMNDTGRSDLTVDDANRAQVRANLLRLLTASGFGVEAKVNSLRRDVEHIYCSSRVITDLRPVFGDAVADGPLRMLVMHTLRLAYHDNDDHDEIYVALSDSQVQRLIDQLHRAQEKARLLTDRYVKGSNEPSRK